MGDRGDGDSESDSGGESESTLNDDDAGSGEARPKSWMVARKGRKSSWEK